MDSIAENQESKRKRWKGQDEYDHKTFKRYELKANIHTDGDLIAEIEQRKAAGEKTSDILRSLARKGMKRK